MNDAKNQSTDTGPTTFAADLRRHMQQSGHFDTATKHRGDRAALEAHLRGVAKHPMIPQEVFDFTLDAMVKLVGWDEFERHLLDGEP